MTDRNELTTEPSWKVDVTVDSSGIHQVTFQVDTYEPVADVEAAMRHLAAVALWWLDSRQFDSLGLADDRP